MKKNLFLAITLVITLVSSSYAQNKKVAVVTFFINKQLDVTEFGNAAYLAETKLSNDPNFNLIPMLQGFHQQFFDGYSKQFPFEIISEDTVLNNAAYKAFNPMGIDTTGLFKATEYLTPMPGYKIVLHVLGTKNERQLLDIFNQVDGVMDVSIDFKLIKIGFGGMGVVKVLAQVNIKLVNKAGDKIFSINEEAKSDKSSALIAGVPIMTSEKILPMCESAMNQLMENLQQDLPKLIKKTNGKL